MLQFCFITIGWLCDSDSGISHILSEIEAVPMTEREFYQLYPGNWKKKSYLIMASELKPIHVNAKGYSV